MNKTLIN